jgi:ribosome-associated protein
VDPEIVSKTKKKREMHELQALGVALAALPESQLQAMSLHEDLLEALLEAKRIRSHEARRRQMQYIGRLMRDLDPAPIRAQLAEVEGHSAQANARHRRLETWRSRLLGDDGALTALAADYPGADLQVLRTLIRNARKEAAEGKPPRAYRELFRVLKDIESSTPVQG